MDYKIRFATPDDHDLIYALKAESVRPYVEKIWGWDEGYQKKDFDSDFSHIKQFNVIEIDGSFAGFVQYYFEYPYFEVIEIHLILEYRGKGIGRKVVSALVQRGKELGYDHLEVGEIYDWNEGSRRCFKSVGFRAYEKTANGAKYKLSL